MNPESIPKLRVIDGGSSRPAPPPVPEGDADAPATTATSPARRRRPLVLLFLGGSLIGGALAPLLQRLLHP